MTYTPEERRKAKMMLPFQRGSEFSVTQQCHVNALRDALQYMLDSALELSCECFEKGAIQMAKETLAQTAPKEPTQ